MSNIFRKPAWPALAIGLLLSTTSSPSVAANITWDGSTDTVWNTNTNWAGNIVPGAADTVIIDIPGGPVVDALATAPVTALRIGNSGTTTLTVENGGEVTTTGDAHIGSLNGSDGTLNIASGGEVNIGTLLRIGNSVGSNGTLSVSGAGSLLSTGTALTVGLTGDGALEIEDGGAVTVGDRAYIGSSATGTATVTGTGSSLESVSHLYVGSGSTGHGTLTVSNGGIVETNNGIIYIGLANGSQGFLNILADGQVTSSNGVILARNAGGNATLVIDGLNARLDTPSLSVGYDGNGTLNIQNGGLADVDTSVSIGGSNGSNGNATVSGVGSLLSASTEIAVGNATTGSLVVESDGRARAHTSIYVGRNNGSNGQISILSGGNMNTTLGSVFLGFNAGSIGAATISGTDSLLESNASIYVGRSGQGTLDILSGGQAHTLSNSIVIGAIANSTGAVTVEGAGSVLESGGGADIYVGELGAGTLTISNNGRASASGTLHIASGNGSTGALNIGAADGEAAATAGDVAAAAIAFGTGTGRIVFNHTDNDYIFGSGITGAGLIDHLAGTTYLNGNSAAFTGAIDVAGGILYANGDFGTADAAVAAGGRLGGSGTLNNLTLANAATIAPGNSIGTLTVNGNYIHAAGAAYDVEVAANGASDLINVTGIADLQGGTVSVTPLAGSYNLMNNYTILSAAGGVNGAFDSASSINMLFDATLNYDTNNVYLRMARNDASFDDIVPGPVGASFDAIPDSSSLKQQLMNQSDAVIAQSLNDAAAAPYSSQAAILPAVQQKIGDVISQRLSGGHMHGAGRSDANASFAASHDAITPAAGDNGSADLINLAFDDDASAADRQRLNFLGNGFAPVDGRYGGWIQGYGTTGQLQDAGATADWNFAGLAAGIDKVIAPDTLAGIAIGHARGHTEIDAARADTDTRLWQAALYAKHKNGPWHAEGQAGYSLARNDAKRELVFGGVPTQLNADYDTHAFSARVEMGRDFDIQDDRDNTITLTPLAGFDYALMHQEAFTEQGAPGLRIAEDDSTSLRTSLGLRASAPQALQNGGYFIPSITGRWRHELADTSSDLNAGFAAAGAGGPTFVANGMDRARNETEISIGLAYAPHAAQTVYATYQTTQSASTSEHGLLLGVNVKW